MKSTIDNATPPAPTYPRLMHYTDTPELVLLVAAATGTTFVAGTVVHAAPGKLNIVGDYSGMWTTEHLVDFHGTVTLSN